MWRQLRVVQRLSYPETLQANGREIVSSLRSAVFRFVGTEIIVLRIVARLERLNLVSLALHLSRFLIGKIIHLKSARGVLYSD
jgi:predicted aspartyl protease